MRRLQPWSPPPDAIHKCYPGHIYLLITCSSLIYWVSSHTSFFLVFFWFLRFFNDVLLPNFCLSKLAVWICFSVVTSIRQLVANHPPCTLPPVLSRVLLKCLTITWRYKIRRYFAWKDQIGLNSGNFIRRWTLSWANSPKSVALFQHRGTLSARLSWRKINT